MENWVFQGRRDQSPVLDFINGLPAKDRARIDLAIRLLYFAYIHHQFVILHGFRKTTNQTSDREIETAIRRMNEILEE